MAAYDISQSDIGRAGVLARLSYALSRGTAAVVRWNEARKTREALYELTDRELDDIGLTRGMIDDVAARDWR